IPGTTRTGTPSTSKRATWSSLGGRRSSDRTTRSPRSRESALLATDQRKTPRVAHGEEADDEAHAGREPRREADRPRVGLRDDLDDGGDERRQRVDLLGEDDGDTIEQHVAQHAAADRGRGAEDDRGLDVGAVGERLVGPGDGEEAQAERVEEVDRVLEALDPGAGPDRHRRGQGGARQVPPVRDAGGRDGTEAKVAHDAAAARRHVSGHVGAEQVESSLAGRGGAADGERERPEEIHQDEQRVLHRAPVPQTESHASAATAIASTPVLRVGCRTGAKWGLWFTGRSFNRPALLARSYVSGSLPPTNQNTDGACHSVPKQPKSSLAGAGPVWWTRSSEKCARNASAIR